MSIRLLVLVFFLVAVGPAAADTLFHRALLIPMEGAPAVIPDGYFVVDEDGRITELGAGAPEREFGPAQQVDLSGRIVIPGFVSAHTHSWQSAARGLAPNGGLTQWIAAKSKIFDSSLLQAGDVELITAHGSIDALLHGITTLYEHNQESAIWRHGQVVDHIPNYNREVFEGLLKHGQRFVFGYRRQGYRSAGYDPRAVEQLQHAETEIQSLRELAAASPYADRLLDIQLSSLGVYFADEALIRGDFALARRLDTGIQLHALEEPGRRERELQAVKFILTELAEDAHRVTFSHFVHPDDEVLTLTAELGARMNWNPLANGRLGSGTPDIERYLAMGIPVGLGVDGAGSADVTDPFENMRSGAYQLRAMKQRADAISVAQVLRAHTLGAAEVIGAADAVGSLRPGKYADFLVLDPDRLDIGPIHDPIGALVLAGKPAHIEAIYIGGEPIVRDGVHLEAREIGAQVEAFMARHRRDVLAAKDAPGAPAGYR